MRRTLHGGPSADKAMGVAGGRAGLCCRPWVRPHPRCHCASRLSFAASASSIASIPVREDVAAPAHVKRPGKDFRTATVDWAAVGANRDRWTQFLKNLFAR